MENRYLIIGNGYIGSAIASGLPNNLTCPALSEREGFKYRDRSYMEKVIKLYKPDAIINATGFCGVNSSKECELEENKEKVRDYNINFVEMLCELCKERDITLGHISTGCLIDMNDVAGMKPDTSLYVDEEYVTYYAGDFPSRTFYLQSKVRAESCVRDLVPKHYIWRLRLPFDNVPHHKNLITKYRKFVNGSRYFNSMTYLPEFVENVKNCLSDEWEYGAYHLTNPGSLSGREIMDTMVKHGLRDKKDNPKKMTEGDDVNNALLKSSSPHVKMTPAETAFDYACAQYALRA